ncbi:MAG: hypothetical protein J6S63_01605 [Atopobiaceae bacterium]|nr:hypothetical protein [Atopobiaceae bacterium]
MLPQEIDAALTEGASDEAQGDLMAFERSRTHSPLHMRRDSLAQANGQLFSSFSAALEYSQNGAVVLQRDFMLTEPIAITTPGVTLDLGGHTLVLGDPQTRRSTSGQTPSLLRIETSGVKVCNGRILISSGSWQGICVQGPGSRVDTLLEDVDITYRGVGYALMVLSGNVLLIDSSIGATGSGIHLAENIASVSMLRSQVLGVQCGISMWNGRLLLEDSSVQGRHAYGIFIKNGWVDASFSTISSLESQALATRAISSENYSLVVRIRNGSQVDSESTNAMLLQGGTVSVLGSMLRSMKDSAVQMGVASTGFDVQPEVLASTKLSLLEGSTVSAWRGDGVRRGAGELVVHESCSIVVSGEAIADDEVPDVVEPEDGSVIDIVAEVENPNAVLQEDEEAAQPEPDVPEEDDAEQDADEDQAKEDADDENDEEDADEDEDILSETPIPAIKIDGVHTRLDYRKPIDFGAHLTTRDGRTDQVEVLFEQWSDGTDVITSDESRAPLSDSTYHYILALRASDGYIFPNYFDIVYKGTSVGHSVMISLDRKIAMVSWGLSVTVPRNRNLRGPLGIVRAKKEEG